MMPKPIYKINVMNVVNIMEVDTSDMAAGTSRGVKNTIPTYSFLITGENIPPILVDTGITESTPDLFTRYIGLPTEMTPEMKYDVQLGKLGYKREDIKIILHTHLHIDHAGNDDLFPNAKIIVPRKELMFSISGVDLASYATEYITYFAGQLPIPGRMRLIDTDAEIASGIFLELTEGHTWGSMNIKVNTQKGLAIICGDIIYNEALSCRKNPTFADVEAHAKFEIEGFGDHPTGNNWNRWASMTAIQKIAREADVILPSHDPLVMEKYGSRV